MTVQIILQYFVQLILPAIFLGELFRSTYKSRSVWFLKILLFGTALFFIFMVSRWDFTSYYLRWLLPVFFVVGAIISYQRITDEDDQKAGWSFLSIHILLIITFLWLNISVIKGLFYDGQSVDLDFPLSNGTYYIGGGGTSRWLNNHTAYPPQDYALDIIELNAFGNRASGIWPDDLTAYEIYGDSVYSPCGGVVSVSANGFEDQIPPNRDSENLAGNHVVVSCKDVDVLLAHLKQQSVAVSEGDSVETGQFLGQVGNSGNTTQPHLHIHAERDGDSTKILDGSGLPLTFDGRFLVRNSLVR